MLRLHLLAADQPQNWFYSAGFGGAMAALAAGLALTGVLVASGRNKRSAAEELEQNRRISELERCWQRFEWLAADRMLSVSLRSAILKRLGETTTREKDTVMANVLAIYANGLAAELLKQGPSNQTSETSSEEQS